MHKEERLAYTTLLGDMDPEVFAEKLEKKKEEKKRIEEKMLADQEKIKAFCARFKKS